jgi:hypothetical protein
MQRFLVLLLLATLSFIYEKTQVRCKTNTWKKELFSLVHHVISTYIYFGAFLFDRPLFHLVFVLATYGHWVIVESVTGVFGCSLTRYYNTVCGLPYEDRFYDLWGAYLYNFLWLTLVWDLYRIGIKK